MRASESVWRTLTKCLGRNDETPKAPAQELTFRDVYVSAFTDSYAADLEALHNWLR
ncbi:hypothetical protein WJX81_002877 [Elliptochloris bilobata]|uniref:Uncharacterized protein n=1 Tax=Elliptochloris bilobata TaxID=381761 RepID=A0AAW1S4U8_9CHLO